VGNEPDVKWQGNVELAACAWLYHDAYVAIKAADPTERCRWQIDFFLTAADPALGYSADGGCLVQRWCLDDITYPLRKSL